MPPSPRSPQLSPNPDETDSSPSSNPNIFNDLKVIDESEKSSRNNSQEISIRPSSTANSFRNRRKRPATSCISLNKRRKVDFTTHNDNNHKKILKPVLKKYKKSQSSKYRKYGRKHQRKNLSSREQNYEKISKPGMNIYCPEVRSRHGLRPIYIDGSNVAYSHGKHEMFSSKGLKICIDYFLKHGHEVKAFIPHFRLRKGASSDPELLQKLYKKNLIITTPTLYIENQQRNPYDDWYVVQAAAANGGVIVSSDNFVDITHWDPNLREVIEKRRLVPTFVDDMLIFPVDPHGNRKNDLEKFLKF